MFFLEREGTLAHMRHEELLARSATARALEQRRRRPLNRRLAGLIGLGLMRLGAALLRYGRNRDNVILARLPTSRTMMSN